MRYESQLIRLQTDGDYRQRLPVSLCGDLLRLLKPLAAGAVRMAVEGASAGKGRTPQWLTTASDIRLVDYGRDGDDTVLALDVPALGEAAPELYEQKEFWQTKPQAECTAVDVLADMIGAVERGETDSPLYDRLLLRRITGLQRVFSEHLHGIELPLRARGTVIRQRVSEAVPVNAAKLAECTPAAQEVRVAGQLDMIRRSTRSFGLQLDDGTEVRGVLESADDVERLGEFFGKRVLVLGKAVYRPSGTLLRLDAHAVEQGEGQPRIFSKVPAARGWRSPVTRTVNAAQSWGVLSSYFGSWPGDETDAEWNEMLLELKQ